MSVLDFITPTQPLDILDIRVGNLLYYGSANCAVTRIKPSDFYDFPEDLKAYRPIPLTIEWAETFGFKYFKSQSRKNTRTWYLNHFFIYFGKQNGPKINNNYPIPYVHNLQNMWWERFKKELTIKSDYAI